MAIKFVLVEIVLVETVLVGDPLYQTVDGGCTFFLTVIGLQHTRAFDHTPAHVMCLQNNVLTSACNVRVCDIFLDLQSAITISKNFAVNLFTSRNRHYYFAL